jgi:protein SCO1/2
MTRSYALSAVALIAAMLGGLGYMILTGPAGDDRFAACRATRVAGGAGTVGGPFALVDASGRTVSDTEVLTEPSLIYFGYTFCPDVCPFDAARNADAVDLLAERGVSVTPVFISIDPVRDTPQAVGEFAAAMHPKMIGLTGSEAQVQAASQAYRTYYRKQDGDPDYYLVDHSTFTYLVLPEHGVVEFFRRETTPEEMADAVACFVGAAG